MARLAHVTAHLLLLVLVATSVPGVAGVISSGSGMQLKDSLNPWYLQNTSEVSYCLEVDQNKFSVPPDQIRVLLNTALAFWRSELAKVPSRPIPDVQAPNNRILLGTQTFTEKSCTSDVDLRFQMGTLAPDQQANLADLDSTLAFTARTNYDRVMMRAKGFIYVAADSGPDLKTGIPARVWSTLGGDILLLTLAHELGHVFGIPDQGVSRSLMSYNAVEDAVAGFMGEPLPEVTRLTRAPKFVPIYLTEGSDAVQLWRQRILGIPYLPCHQVQWQVQLQGHQLQISVARDDGTYDVVGEAQLHSEAHSPDAAETLASVWLPPEQKLYKRQPLPQEPLFRPGLRYNLVPVLVDHLSGVYQVRGSGVKTMIEMTLSPGGEWPPRIRAVVDGALIEDLFRFDIPGPYASCPVH